MATLGKFVVGVVVVVVVVVVVAILHCKDPCELIMLLFSFKGSINVCDL